MGGVHLTVDQAESPALELAHQVHERDLGGIGDAREHRLPVEHAPDRDAIEAADQFAVDPGFDRMGVARRRAGPCRPAIIGGVIHVPSLAEPRRRAALHHGPKRGIGAHLVIAAAQALGAANATPAAPPGRAPCADSGSTTGSAPRRCTTGRCRGGRRRAVAAPTGRRRRRAGRWDPRARVSTGGNGSAGCSQGIKGGDVERRVARRGGLVVGRSCGPRRAADPKSTLFLIWIKIGHEPRKVVLCGTKHP